MAAAAAKPAKQPTASSASIASPQPAEPAPKKRRWPLLRQLEFIIAHLDVDDSALPTEKQRGVSPMREIWPRLVFYRANAGERAALFKMYHAELSKAENAAAKADAAAGKNLDVEAARVVLDDFMSRWDGTDPMVLAPQGEKK